MRNRGKVVKGEGSEGKRIGREGDRLRRRQVWKRKSRDGDRLRGKDEYREPRKRLGKEVEEEG